MTALHEGPACIEHQVDSGLVQVVATLFSSFSQHEDMNCTSVLTDTDGLMAVSKEENIEANVTSPLLEG